MKREKNWDHVLFATAVVRLCKFGSAIMYTLDITSLWSHLAASQVHACCFQSQPTDTCVSSISSPTCKLCCLVSTLALSDVHYLGTYLVLSGGVSMVALHRFR